MLTVEQSSFSGGFNQRVHPTKIGDNEYSLLINGRVRDEAVEPIKGPTDLSALLPAGKKQGLYVAGTILIAFVDGKAYYKTLENSAFIKILNLQLDPNVEYIHFSLVPASTVNFARSSGSNPNSDIVLGANVTPSPSCALVQDGINQPWIILPNTFARITKNYSEWTQEIREYVPIGINLLWNGDIHYCIGQDENGTLNQILRSVSGRPLDFMVNIDQNGDKLNNEQDGNARSVSYRVDYDSITAVSKSSAVNGGFVVSTLNNSYMVTADYSDTIFGEPRFRRQFLFASGPLNNFSTIDSLGDTFMIVSNGVISFNAVLQTANEGRNVPLSKSVRRLFDNVFQTITCAGKLDNYVYLGVNTIYGAGILVYDELQQVFVSLDILFSSNDEFVKQFAVINTNTVRKIFCITTKDKFYELYNSSDVKPCSIYLGEWRGQKSNSDIKCVQADLKFDKIETAGEVTITIVIDGINDSTNTKVVTDNFIEQPLPVTVFPYGNVVDRFTLPLTFAFPDSHAGNNIGIFITFDFKASLLSVNALFEEQDKVVSINEDSFQQLIQF